MAARHGQTISVPRQSQGPAAAARVATPATAAMEGAAELALADRAAAVVAAAATVAA